MDQDELKKQEAKCTQENPPACTASCPIHVDARKLMLDIQNQDLKSALATLQKKQPFPGIISRICDHPCEAECKRQEAGAAIAISALERFCVQNQTTKLVKAGIIPPKSQTVAVVGSGLRGLTVAYDLAKKGYKVSLFEKAVRLGGDLWNFSHAQLPPEVIVEELSVLNRLNVQIHLNTAITQQDLAKLQEEFKVVYLGLAAHSQEISELLGAQSWIDPVTCATPLSGIFSGAVVGNDSPIKSVADGRKAAVSIDRFLQGVSLTASRVEEGPYETQLFVNTKGIIPLPAVKMSNNGGYTTEEAIQESGRCLDCQCLECVKACKYMQEYGDYPKKYLRQIYNNDTIVMGMRHGNKMINSCSLCGQCAVICPQGLDLGETCKATRESMVSKGKMPPSAHDFALRDMAFNNSEEFTLTRHQPGHNSSQYVFFPGCQLSGSSPEQVEKVYDYLTEKLSGGVALMLRCCGAPADWAGDQTLFQSSLEILTTELESIGKPQLIVACSTCHSVFRERFPGVISLWELMADLDLPVQSAAVKNGKKLAVQDACTTRNEPIIQDAVRNILTKLGCEVEELPYSKERTKCCGFGGLTSFANPELAKKIVEDRISESSTDYVAYCAMCRDNFAAKGKRTVHLLDLIFGTDLDKAAIRPRVGFSYRHENRAKLKRTLLHSLWQEIPQVKDVAYLTVNLKLNERVLEIMEDRRILIEDIQQVIELAERTGRKFINPDNGHSLAYFRPVKVTYWVEYQPQEQGFVVLNVYSHRMEIVEENHE